MPMQFLRLELMEIDKRGPTTHALGLRLYLNLKGAFPMKDERRRHKVPRRAS
jgi:hypothetical protein